MSFREKDMSICICMYTYICIDIYIYTYIYVYMVVDRDIQHGSLLAAGVMLVGYWQILCPWHLPYPEARM